MKPSERIRQLEDEELAKAFTGSPITEMTGVRATLTALIRYLDELAEGGALRGLEFAAPNEDPADEAAAAPLAEVRPRLELLRDELGKPKP